MTVKASGMKRTILLVCGTLLGSIVFGPAANAAEERPKANGVSKRTGQVRVVGHVLMDDEGPFLGLGVSYFTALQRCRNDRARMESDLRFLSEQGFNYYRMLSMVGWHRAWDGLEIAPVTFTNRGGKCVEAWPDYWKQVTELIVLGSDR